MSSNLLSKNSFVVLDLKRSYKREKNRLDSFYVEKWLADDETHIKLDLLDLSKTKW